MKKSRISGIILILLIVGCQTMLIAQKPQKILGIAKEEKSQAYYEEQARLWKNEIDKNKEYADGWINYYRAERAKLQLERPDLWPGQKEVFYRMLQPIINQAKNHIGNTFDYYYLLGMNTKDEASINAFLKAYEIDPERSEIYGWLLVHYITNLDDDQVAVLSKKMLQTNVYSDPSLKWNYNGLQSIDMGGIIITNGDMDSLPKWVLQYGEGIRPDIMVVNKWMLATEDAYREKILSKLEMSSLSKTKDDFGTTAEYVDFLSAALLKGVKRPAYMSAGTDLQFFEAHQLENNIYVVGNVLKYSKEDFNNTAEMRDNFENKYFMEYLLQHFQQHPQNQVVKTRMNLTYLPALIHLRDHYKEQNQLHKVETCNRYINTIAEDSGRKDEVLSWFE